ncbi:MAG: hypothetical protein SFU25_09530 [Candidatus Caenarcaniphilales bacterium]|nr:hypothetical protein [Candidatus Caenarcaniphilales bacterium]
MQIQKTQHKYFFFSQTQESVQSSEVEKAKAEVKVEVVIDPETKNTIELTYGCDAFEDKEVREKYRKKHGW